MKPSNICVTLQETPNKTLALEIKSKFPAGALEELESLDPKSDKEKRAKLSLTPESRAT